MSKRYSHVPPNGGKNYDWSADHTFVKVSAADTGGQYTLMEDNLKANFKLGLHLHRYHAETFYILEGNVDFYVDGDWMVATPGTCIHIPPGIEHACVMAGGCEAARMLMIYQPSGFDQFLAELARMDDADFEDEAKMAALNEKYDIVNIGPVPEREAPMNLISATLIKTEKASGYLQQLCKHFGHKIDAEYTADAGWIQFPFGRSEFEAGPAGLKMVAQANTTEDLARLQNVLVSHLERFAFREDLEIDWSA